MASILVVDDEADILEEIVEILEEAGHQARSARDGRAALEEILTDPPDLVLCDITMPRMNGFELLTVIRERHPVNADIPFIYLSARSENADIVAGRTLGAHDYLTKPIDCDALLETINAWLAVRSRRHSPFGPEPRRTLPMVTPAKTGWDCHASAWSGAARRQEETRHCGE